jgi:hypothetical protein
MPNDRNFADAEQDWIERYRTALSDTPTPPSLLAKAKLFVLDSGATILSRVGRIVRGEAAAQAAKPVARTPSPRK